MSSDEQPIQLALTEEQQEMIHKLTGEHANVLELVLGADGTSGTGCGIQFNWRVSLDSGIPRQQWSFRKVTPPPIADGGASA
jgi:hypothetical protein